MVQLRIKPADRTAEVNLPMSGAADGITHLKVYLMHSAGKGFYLSLLGIQVSINDYGTGFNSETHTMFHDRHKRFRLEACPRYNAKRLAALAAAIEGSINQRVPADEGGGVIGVLWDRIVIAAAGWGGEVVLEKRAEVAA